MIILIDMDEVLADFEQGLIKKWNQKYPNRELFANGARKSFYVGTDATTPSQSDEVRAIIGEKGFFSDLEPIPGAIEALSSIRDLGHETYILTSPGTSYNNAAGEKYNWVVKHFDKGFLANLIITPAKHLIRGDILIDDRPTIPNEERASWEHVLFDRPYNQNIEDKRRLTWANWKDVLTELHGAPTET